MSKEKQFSLADIERARAESFSSAADMICNSWNLLPRTKHWLAMTPKFQGIWKDLKDASARYHETADNREADGK